MEKMRDSKPLLATLWGPKPGDFPIGSPESRAAARAVLKHAEEAKPQPPWTPEDDERLAGMFHMWANDRNDTPIDTVDERISEILAGADDRARANGTDLGFDLQDLPRFAPPANWRAQ